MRVYVCVCVRENVRDPVFFGSKVKNEGLYLCECRVALSMICLFFLFYDCFCCTDTCQNTMIILNYFIEYINDLHISLNVRKHHVSLTSNGVSLPQF